MNEWVPFEKPIFVTRPLLPDFDNFVSNLKEIWENKWLTNNGPKLSLLQDMLKVHLEVDHLSLFCNGTIALMLGLKALDLSGEVITTPFTFPATLECLDWNGLQPVFCDIDPVSLTIDADIIESHITERTSAILGVHVFGNACDVQRIDEIASKHHLKVVYDAAHAFGTKVKGKPIASWGDLTMFSFHATKLFNTFEGGAIVTNYEELISKVELLKNFGIQSEAEVLLSGLNGKMNEFQAAVGIGLFPLLVEERKKRRAIIDTYMNRLSGVPGILAVTSSCDPNDSLQYFAVRINKKDFGISRDSLYDDLKKMNVYARKYFSPLCSSFDWYKNEPSAAIEMLPVAAVVVDEILCLPLYGDLLIEDVHTICDIICNSRHNR